MDFGKLYVIAGPIGNLRDITLRAIDTLKSLNSFYAEDTREFKHLLSGLNIPLKEKRISAYNKHNLKEANLKVIQQLKMGESIGFMTDRGTPCISDPGSELVHIALLEGISVIPIPGVSSLITALSVCGFDIRQFSFLGFFPDEMKKQEATLQWVFEQNHPILFLEAPHRIKKTLTILKQHFSSGTLFVAREMTKKFETFHFTSLEDLNPEDYPELGEFTLILSPPKKSSNLDELKTNIQMRFLSDKEWSKMVAKNLNVSAKVAYDTLQQYKKNVKKV